MEHNAVIVVVAAVTVTFPIFLAHVDFHVAPNDSLPSHFQESVTKVRARSGTHAAGVYDTDPSPALSTQPLLASRLLLPQSGQKALGYPVFIGCQSAHYGDDSTFSPTPPMVTREPQHDSFLGRVPQRPS